MRNIRELETLTETRRRDWAQEEWTAARFDKTWHFDMFQRCVTGNIKTEETERQGSYKTDRSWRVLVGGSHDSLMSSISLFGPLHSHLHLWDLSS